MLNRKNVLITGISSFVGPQMARLLLENEANIFGLVRRRANRSIPENIKYFGVEKEVRLLEGDIQDISSIAFALDVSKPDVIFHFGAQSFIPRSFSHPLETIQVNCMGSANLLEAVRIKTLDPVIIFPGSSEEYGLVISSKRQYEEVIAKYGVVFPAPRRIPELPITEHNPLRPMSPYGVSKVYGDYLMRNYHTCYKMKTIVSRGFNHEGAGRGIMFVTSDITSQVMKLKAGEIDKITIGNVNAFRDWSHIEDILKGYYLLAERGKYGEVYNQGSQRTNSVLSYILLSLEVAGYEIDRIETLAGKKKVENPTEIDGSEFFGLKFEKTKVDRMMLEGNLEFHPADRGIFVYTNKGRVLIEFDSERFRVAEVPILMSNTQKIQKIGFEVNHTLKDIISDQLNYFKAPRG